MAWYADHFLLQSKNGSEVMCTQMLSTAALTLLLPLIFCCSISCAEEVVEIPLNEIVTTGPQNGLQHGRDLFQQDESEHKRRSVEEYLRQIQSIARGSSNVFLVDATNIFDAISASFSILVGTRSADTPAPVNTAEPIRGSHWLVAYLGSGPSSPSWWKVEETKIAGNTITFSYRKTLPSPATKDIHPYFYWIPLGNLSPGAYEIRLFDTHLQVTSLLRRVEVSP